MHPAEVDANLKLAKSRLQAGDVADAEAMLRSVLDAQADCAPAAHFLGMCALQRGKLDDALNWVRRSIEMDGQDPIHHSNLSMVLGSMKRYPEAVGAAQRAIELREDLPDAWNNKGIALDKLRRLDEAIENYRRAIDLRSDYPEALGNLGDALSRKGEHDQAVEVLDQAVRVRPKEAIRHKTLAHALRRAGRARDAVIAYRRAIELNPKDADAYNNLGAALSELGQVVESERTLRVCLSFQPNHTDAHLNLSLSLLAQGKWREGWIEYEWRQHLKVEAGSKRGFLQPAWNGAPLEDRTILVSCEQGLGDTIQFVRYVPLLADQGARVIVECQAKLRPLLEGMKGAWKVIARGEPLPQFDVHTRLLSLPGIFGTTPETVPAQVPYLRVDENRVKHFQEVLGPKDRLRVGLVWQGSSDHRRDRLRSIPLAMFAPLSQVGGVQFVNLQKGPGSEQMDATDHGLKLLRWSDPADMTDQALMDTAAVIQNLDLVISVDTSIAHLAGALGIPVWVALSAASDWRWLLDREDTPWYPTMRLFRQTSLGRWDDVIDRLAKALQQTLTVEPSGPHR